MNPLHGKATMSATRQMNPIEMGDPEMFFEPDGAVFKGAYANMNFGALGLQGQDLPLEYTGARDEIGACDRTAWLGLGLNCSSMTVCDISGTDAPELLESVCVNAGFGEMKPGSSKHALLCNPKGELIADGVCMYRGDGVYRTYALAPVIEYFIDNSGLDVQHERVTDEFFIQIDGPKALEILEDASRTDLHDIRFARNRQVEFAGHPVAVHRLGMSGHLAYELHGREEDAEEVYATIRESLEKFDGRPLGFRHYCTLNHTPAGYPNQNIHYDFAYYNWDEGFAQYARENCPPQMGLGSAYEDQDAYHVTPYDVDWGYLVNFDHEFRGKEALQEIAANPPRKMVTLEWNPDDVAEVFKAQFLGDDFVNYEPIEPYNDSYNASSRGITVGSWVLDGEKKVGLATGRCYAFNHHTMISLANIGKEYAEEGTELAVLWGGEGYEKARIRAKVAQFPYYQGEYRNETFDTEKIPHPSFD